MIIVMGLPGAGKSSVLAGIEGMVTPQSDRAGLRGSGAEWPQGAFGTHSEVSGWKTLNYGTLMFEIAKERFGLSHRDELRRLPVEKQKKVQEEVALRLSKERGKVILDTHCSIKTPRGYLPGLPFSLLEKLTIDAVVLITANPEEIMGRRKADESRVRDPETLDSIREHDLMNKALLASYAAHRGCPARIIYNHDGKLEEAVRQLRGMLE
ncbi:MAG: adenylate kinase [Candidatus Micrarchaeota archaeon]